MGVICCKTKGGSQCCAMFSFTGVVFLMYVYIVFSLQPEYVHGLDDDTVKIAQQNSWTGATMYAVSMGISIASFYYHKKQEQRNAGRSASSTGLELEELDLGTPLIPESSSRHSSTHERETFDNMRGLNDLHSADSVQNQSVNREHNTASAGADDSGHQEVSLI